MVTKVASENPLKSAPTAGGHPIDGVLYYVKSRSGEVNVARYLARHNLYFAVGDSIGYFPGDLEAIGKPVPLDNAFDP